VRRATAASGTRAGLILKGRTFTNGYVYVCLRNHPAMRYVQVHRLVAAAFIGPGTPEQHVNHRDGTKTNNAAGNLEYVTPAGNSRHAAELGLVQQGERHYAARLTADDVRAIRSQAVSGISQRALARAYGTSRSAIVHILSGKNWRTVQ
jgi:DNA-binding transcriptional regulator YiaG